jgi:putative membrane protein
MTDHPKTDLATARTDLAEDRTILANERTYAGWLRTGFAGIGIGLAFNALFNRLEPAWVPRTIATAFLVVAILIFVIAERRSSAVLNRLHAHQVKSFGRKRMLVITAISVLATMALIAAIWMLPIKLAPPAEAI